MQSFHLVHAFTYIHTYTHTIPHKGDIAVYTKQDLSICPKDKESNKYKREGILEISESVSQIKSPSGSVNSGSVILGSIVSGSVRSGSVNSGSVNSGSVRSGSVNSGSVTSHINEHTDVLSLKCTWEKVHQLGISKLFIKFDTNFLITLSFDCSCKILDATTGNSVYNLQNSHNCMYMGVTWSPMGHFYLCDELGYLEVFSSQKERNVACLQLLQTGSERRTENILGEHRDPGKMKYFLKSISILISNPSSSFAFSMNVLVRSFSISHLLFQFITESILFMNYEHSSFKVLSSSSFSLI